MIHDVPFPISEAMPVKIPVLSPNFPAAAVPSSVNLNISYRDPNTGLETSKILAFSAVQMPLLETILRRVFSVRAAEGVMILLNEAKVVYPITDLDLIEAASAWKCELQTFLLPTAMSASMTANKPTVVPNQQPVISDDDDTNAVTSNAKNQPAKKAKKPSVKVVTPSVQSASSVAVVLSNEREDKRKFNRGLDHRKSYLKEEKMLIMFMKDSGRSAEEIALHTGVSKSNVEKWCSDKTRQTVLAKFFSQHADSAVAQAVDPQNKLHFTARGGSGSAAETAWREAVLFLLERLAMLSSDSGIDHAVIRAMLSLPSAPVLPHAQTTAVPSQYARSVVPQPGEVFSAAWDTPVYEPPTESLGPSFKRKKESDMLSVFEPSSLGMSSFDDLDLMGSPLSLTSGSMAVPSVSAWTSHSETGQLNLASQKNPFSDFDDDDDASILSGLAQRLQERRSTASMSDGCPSDVSVCGADAKAVRVERGVALNPHLNSDVTMQYNACTTWSMDALLEAATLLEERDRARSHTTKTKTEKTKSCCPAGQAASAPINKPLQSRSCCGGNNCTCPPSAGCCPVNSNYVCPTAVSSVSATLSLQAQRPVLPNTQYLQFMRAKHRESEALRNGGSTRSEETQMDKEDKAMLRLLGE